MFDDLLYVIAAFVCYTLSIYNYPSYVNMLRQFNEFCNHTSLHGWRYLADSKMSKPKNMFWFLILCASITGATILIYINTVTFKNATIVIAVETMTAPLSEIFFPSITVCNINQARKSFFDELGIRNNETLIRQIHSEYLGASNKKPKGSLPKDLIKRLREIEKAHNSLNWAVHQKCSDMYLQSTWNGYTYDNSTEIDYDFGTDYGICCWFTPQLNYTDIVNRFKATHGNRNFTRMGQMDINGYWFKNVQKGAASGKHNGYNILFDIESFDYMYYMEGSEGVKVTVLHHLDMPLTRQNSFNLSPGTENQIAVTPSIITTEENAISRLSPAERDCYTENEISLKYLPLKDGYRYGMDNCLFISAFERILEACKCYPGYNHNLIPGKSLEYEPDNHHGPCSGPNLTCMNDILLRIGKYRYVNANGKKMKCRSSCEDQTNKLFVTTSTYPNKNTFQYRDEFCVILSRLLNKCNGIKRISLSERYPNMCEDLKPLQDKDPELYCNENQWNPEEIDDIIACTSNTTHRNSSCNYIENHVLQYAKDNLVIIHLSIKDPYAQKFQKEEKMPIISYIANLGGLLGFGLGFSVITGIEIVYHFLSAIILSILGRSSSSHTANIEDSCNSNHRKKAKNVNINQSCWAESENDTARAISVEIDYCKTLNITV